MRELSFDQRCFSPSQGVSSWTFCGAHQETHKLRETHEISGDFIDFWSMQEYNICSGNTGIHFWKGSDHATTKC